MSALQLGQTSGNTSNTRARQAAQVLAFFYNTVFRTHHKARIAKFPTAAVFICLKIRRKPLPSLNFIYNTKSRGVFLKFKNAPPRPGAPGVVKKNRWRARRFCFAGRKQQEPLERVGLWGKYGQQLACH